MENLYCIEFLNTDPEAENLGALFGKYDDKAVTLMTWRSAKLASEFIEENGYPKDDYKVKDFSLAVYDKVDRWGARMGINVFIHVLK